MKLKKSLVKILAIGSIFFVFSFSFGGVISLQDDSLDNFWSVKKLSFSLVDTSYAESGGQESGWKESGGQESGYAESGGQESGRYTNSPNISSNTSLNSNCRIVYDTVTTASGVEAQEVREVCDVNNNNNNEVTPIETYVSPEKVIVKREYITTTGITLKDSEKLIIKDRINKFNSAIDKKYTSSNKRFEVYERLSALIGDKISTLESIKVTIKDESLIEKYEKKILLFSEINILLQERLLVHIQSINFSLIVPKENNIGEPSTIQPKVVETPKLVEVPKTVVTQNTVDNSAEQARIAENNAAAARLAEQARLAAAAKAAEDARIAAQAAAAAAASTTTAAS